MRLLRLIVIWATLLAMLLLAALSVVGAFLGAVKSVEVARAMFNSVPLVIFWFLCVGLLVAGLLCFKRLVRSPGLLAVHAGSVLILAGAMYGSAGGHAVAEMLFGTRKIPSAYMRIYEGHTDSTLRDGRGKKIGSLPFRIGLKDFSLEYYEDGAPWRLGVDAPPAGASGRRRQKELDWAVGREIEVPFAGARLKVLRYLPRARGVYAEGGARMLEVVDAEGKRTTVPAKVGQRVALDSPKGTLRIVKVFSHLVVRGGRAVNIAGSSANPALKLEFEDANGEKVTRWAYTRRFSAHWRDRDGVKLLYLPPRLLGVRADPASNVPAMEILLTHKARRVRKWLLPKDPDRPLAMSLTPLVGVIPAEARGARAAHDGHRHDRNAYLVMARPRGMIKDYKSELVVLEEGRQTAEKVIEVNDPLHYGGYHFYQHSYDAQHNRYTVLSVKSDSGLWAVYGGFILVCAGVFWQFWFRPALGYLLKRRGDDDGNGDKAQS